MKGRLLVMFGVLALAAPACAEPGIEESAGTFTTTEVSVSSAPQLDLPPGPSEETVMTDSTAQPAESADGDQASATTATSRADSGSDAQFDRGSVPPEIFDSLIGYAMEQLNVSGEDISVESSSAWSWPDTAFGCPAKDRLYAPVLTEGYWVVLNAHGQQLDFRVGDDGTFFICDPNRPLPENDERSP